MIRILAAQEFKSLFRSPLGWVLLAVIQLILAYLFLAQIDTYLISIQPRTGALENFPGVTDLIVAPLYGNAGVVMLLLIPLITMRAISAERHDRTLTLLNTAPLSITEIVLGKYIGVLAFNSIVIVLVTSMPVTLALGTDLDIGKLSACILALFLLLASFSAIGIYISSLADQPTTAATVTFGALLFMWILDWGTRDSGSSQNVLEYLSILSHFNQLRTGLVTSEDLIYYLIVIFIFLTLTIKHLDSERLSG